MRGPIPEEEGAAEMYDELTTAPIPVPLHYWGEGGENIGTEAETKK